MKKFLASALMFLVLLASAVQGQVPVEQRWFNFLPSDYVYSAFSTGDKLGYVTTDFVGVLPTGATVQLSSDMFLFISQHLLSLSKMCLEMLSICR